jgi:tRNA1(Val) A37 N6-methylase TrmN6
MDSTLTRDAFLGGRITLAQPAQGYRAGVDPVLLAASVPAKPGQSVLELGCGAGAAMFCLAGRVPGLALTGIEMQTDYAALARQNASENGFAAEVITGDLAQMPDALRARRFDQVLANPPYFHRHAGMAAAQAGREAALGEVTPLDAWVAAAAKRCAPKGYVSFIHRAERLPELLALITTRLGSVQVLPLIPRRGRAARLVIVRARQGGRAEFRLLDGLVMHEGDAHQGDRENYSPAMTSVLRHGAALKFPT